MQSYRSKFYPWIILLALSAMAMCQSSDPRDNTNTSVESSAEASGDTSRSTGPSAESADNSSMNSGEDSAKNGNGLPDDNGERGVEVVEKPGIYVYNYPETLQLEDPYENYLSKRRVFDDRLAADIKSLLAEEEGYTPEYKARCLPVYDYGIVLVGEDSRQTYLFSFRCNTMHYKEKKLWKDFSPIRTRLYTLLQYQVNDNTSVLMDSRDY